MSSPEPSRRLLSIKHLFVFTSRIVGAGGFRKDETLKCHVHFHFGMKTENRSETDEALTFRDQVISKFQLCCSDKSINNFFPTKLRFYFRMELACLPPQFGNPLLFSLLVFFFHLVCGCFVGSVLLFCFSSWK